MRGAPATPLAPATRTEEEPHLRTRPPLAARFACLAALLLPAAAPAGASAGLRLDLEPAEVAASEQLSWNFTLKLVNGPEAGFYSDSLTCRLEDTGPGARGGARMRVVPMPAVAQSIGTLSAGDSAEYQQAFPAAFEHGTISFVLHGHRSDGSVVSVESPALRLIPGPVSAAHPSEFLTVGGRKVEIVTFPSAREGPAPGLLFVHGDGEHARALLATGLQLAARGFTAVFVSMPGHGLSEGEPDRGGAASVAALGAALDRLKRTPGVDASRLGAWGVSRGASAVAALAARRGDLAAVVLQSGYYDATGPLKPRAATLVLHGEADAEAPVANARSLAASLEKAGVAVESRFVPNAGHALPRADVQRAAHAYLDARLRR